MTNDIKVSLDYWMDETNKKIQNIIDEPIVMLIPDCCREHWDSCPHVVNKTDFQKKKKRNIAL